MDIRTTKKEKIDPNTTAVTSGIFEVYPTFSDINTNEIIDIDFIDGEEEKMESAVFSMLKQKGADPLDVKDGISWAEALIGEIHPSIVVAQVKEELKNGFNVMPVIQKIDGKEYVEFSIVFK